MSVQPSADAVVTGYVLAGGRSRRMGQDKALLALAGRPLIEQAVRKLRRVVGDVRILSNRHELAEYGPLVPDLREGCGPLGGIEAALGDARSQWILVLPVDMPFLPSALIGSWVESVLRQEAARIAFIEVAGVSYPALCMLHREVAPGIGRAIDQSRLKLYSAFKEAAREVALVDGVPLENVLVITRLEEVAIDGFFDMGGKFGGDLPSALSDATSLWFMNLNTPEEFARAEEHRDELEANDDPIIG